MDSLSYDGETIATYVHKGRAFEEGEILHEICHYVAATSEERRLPEFGMVARPSMKMMGIRDGSVDDYFKRAPTPIIERPQRHIRECATQYLHHGVAIVLDMCPAVPKVKWEIWTRAYQHKWNTLGVDWLRSQGYDPDELVSRMIGAAQLQMAA
jgi:hypothetical protein